MRTIIAGSRTITNPHVIAKAIAQADWEISCVVSGTARGVDKLGEQWAEANGVDIDRYPAQWDTHGKAAGYRRNVVMAENADAAIVIWDGKSKGAKHMIDIAKAHNLRLLTYSP